MEVIMYRMVLCYVLVLRMGASTMARGCEDVVSGDELAVGLVCVRDRGTLCPVTECDVLI